MEKNRYNLKTTDGVLDAYFHALRTGPLFGGADNSKVMEKITGLMAKTPIRDFVTASVARKEFDLAIVFLNDAYNRNRPGSPEDRVLAKIGMDMVDAAITDKKFHFAEWAFKRACEVYPPESHERREVIRKMFPLHGTCLAARGPGLADGYRLAELILERAVEIYPTETAEYRNASKMQKKELAKRRASPEFGKKPKHLAVISPAVFRMKAALQKTSVATADLNPPQKSKSRLGAGKIITQQFAAKEALKRLNTPDGPARGN